MVTLCSSEHIIWTNGGHTSNPKLKILTRPERATHKQNMKNFNEEYYVMKVDGADNHPILAWGETDMIPFLYIKEIENDDLEFPLELEFDTPYPKKPEMADILDISSTCVFSEKIKLLFEKLQIPQVQFIPATIVTNKKQKIEGHYIFHCWNGIPAVDKENYEGDPVDEDGEIVTLEKFSLDSKVLSDIEQENRLVFRLAETPSFIIVHKSIKEAIENEQATGFRFYSIAKWSPSAIFEED